MCLIEFPLEHRIARIYTGIFVETKTSAWAPVRGPAVYGRPTGTFYCEECQELAKAALE